VDKLESEIRRLTQPVNGQYPRPWMTQSTDPASSRLFIVGMNQASTYDTRTVGTHSHFINCLFNRGDESGHQLYDRLTGRPSRTRANIQNLVDHLVAIGISDVIETNVVCYSTPMSADLRETQHRNGVMQGREIFDKLLDIVQPEVLIVHGSGTVVEMNKLAGTQLPRPNFNVAEPISHQWRNRQAIIIPSLAPPAFNRWANESDGHMDKICSLVAARLKA